MNIYIYIYLFIYTYHSYRSFIGRYIYLVSSVVGSMVFGSSKKQKSNNSDTQTLYHSSGYVNHSQQMVITMLDPF